MPDLPPVVVLSKGASARNIPPGPYHIAACSEAVRLCDACEWLAVNDMPALDSLTAEDMAKAQQIVLPAWLHLDPYPRGLVFWHSAIMQQHAARVLDVNLFELHTSPDRNGRLPFFGRCRSVSDSLIAWLLHRGYRTILTSGIETDGKSDYHPLFSRQAPKTRTHRKSIWKHTLKRIQEAGATVQRFEESEYA